MELETRPAFFAIIIVACLLYLRDGNFGVYEILSGALTYWVTKYGKFYNSQHITYIGKEI